MKHLLIYTSTLLRTAMLLGVLAIIHIPAVAQTAGLPDAFETMDPGDIIGDGNYYYIQFYEGSVRSYLTDCGVNKRARAKDFLPYTNNRLWTLVSVGIANQFKLRNKDGHYIKFGTFESASRYGCVDNSNDASILTFHKDNNGCYISEATNQGQILYRPSNNEWNDLANIDDKGYNRPLARLRFAKLKSNSAFIIYYRGEGIDNDNPGAETTRHYLTYSGTAESSLGTNWRQSDVSSRQSIIPKDMPLSDLPTLAAYHKDGLWTIEPAEVDGQFYIKKYGSSEYLNEDHKWDNVYDSKLGAKDATKGTYTLETPSANRYTRVQNVKYDSEVQLTAGMFYNWNGYGAGAAKTSEDAATVSWYMGSEQAGGATIAGTDWVDYLTYADLSEYQRMTINGTAGTQMRVMLNRQESNNGSWAEKNVTIGSDGKAVVDLSYIELNHVVGWVPEVKMTYVNGSDGTLMSDNVTYLPDNRNTSYGPIAWGDPAYCGFNKIENGKVELATKKWGVNNLAYLQVDVSAFTGVNGTIRSVTLEGEFQQISDRKLAYGVGYNSSEWSASMTWNTADRSITLLGSTQEVGVGTEDKWLSFEITDAFKDSSVKTILVYNLIAGAGYIKNPRVKVEYEPTVKEILPYAHLNAIKIASGSPAGTISSITLAKESNSNVRYLNHADGDGWQVLQWPEPDANDNYWYAGFYPVEVLSPNEDNLYQAVLMKNGKMLGTTKGKLKEYNTINLEGWTVEMTGDYQHFRLKNSAGQYYKSNEVLTLDASEAWVFTISELTSEAGKGFYTSQFIPKTETRILHDVTHKLSNVRLYYANNPTSQERQKLYSQQGLITNDLSEWLNSDGTQKVNEFKITHYVKKGETVELGLPTTLRTNNDHILYQRWYNYQNDRDLDGLKSRFSVSTSAGTVMDYLYNNGMVTGVRVEDLPVGNQSNAEGKLLDWPTVFPGTKTYVSHLFTYKNSNGLNFTLAADVSRYNDFAYQNSSSHLDGNLQEPTLTMRYIYDMRDAKDMATQLMACTYNSDKWLEKKTFHFPAKRLAYETQKQAEYQGEFIGIRHNFKDYWVFNGSGTTDDDLVSAVIDNTSGRIEVVIDDAGSTGISLGGHNNEGYYLYDEGNKRGTITRLYGESRFIVFNYPGETVNNAGESHKAYIKVYFKDGETRYQIALFEIIFDENTSTLPWTDTDATKRVQGSTRDPKNLVKKAGEPIAKITFDYPEGATFKNSSEIALHNLGYMYGEWSEIANSSPVPLTFGKTNYGFDGDNPSWGSYALVKTMSTLHGNRKTANPVNHDTTGYNIAQDVGMESAFLYIDASEQPGEICSVPFQGEFCAGDKLMCSGWISGSNKIIDNVEYRCPGSVILTVKGKNTGEDEEPIYRFCPGQCYELDQGDYVNWQQFYFEFNITKKYEQYWVEVNNNCVSSQGGDFMLDNIEVYAFVPEAIPAMNTPICINKDASEMQLLKVSLGFEKILSAIGATEVTGDANGEDKSYAFVYLDKNVFLTSFQSELSSRYSISKTIAELESIIKTGEYGDKAVTDYLDAYKAAFNAAVLGDPTKLWDSNDRNNANTADAAVLNFHWNTNFSKMDPYTFAKAVTKQGAVFAETDSETGERLIVMNGNYSNQLPWKINTDYYIVPYDHGVTTALSGNALYEDFNIWSLCNKKRVFQIKPPLNILSMESSDVTQDLEVCEGKIPTLLTDLKGYTVNGVEVSLTGLSFDWWLGDLSANPKVLATLDNYHNQTNAAGTVRLDEALATLRVYYPDVTSLEGVTEKLTQTPNLTFEMIYYLQGLVDKGQLILHQTTISVPAQKASDDDPYFYLVACPIHDGYFDKALNNGGTDNVAYFCDEPLGLRIKVRDKAPSLKCGFVPNENGFETYQYPDGNPILSIRLAKKAQFETVKHGTTAEAPKEWESNPDLNFLWMPIRDAKVESTNSSKVIVKSDDYNVYLASTDDPEWDKTIFTEMTKVNSTTHQWIGSLPIVGKIVKLNAIDMSKNSGMTEKDENRLCIYFTENFDVREGYNYTLSLPFREDGNTNACDGTLLINLKIVPDYEVWTGAAGNTDWNNDKNWRRADGNTANSGINQDELYVGSAANSSPLHGYTTNYDNYRTDDDRSLRKGYAPLYCTHILMKSDEWADAPVLYDALNGKSTLDNYPFANLSDGLKYDIQTRVYDIWSDTYGSNPDKGRTGDLISEMYQINSCDEIAFQPATELINAHLLNYNNAWMEYQLDMNRWYLLGSPLQGTISGEWYAPTGTAQQKTTYYDNVTFGSGYDRYSPAIYQRSWDKAKTVLYEVGSTYANSDDSQTENLGSASQGQWSSGTWNTTGADNYLDRLGYKPMGGKKVNVAIKGVWSNTYNDATVDYATGGFSVMVLNNLKSTGAGNANPAIIRLPKEDTMYDYYRFDETGAADGGTDTDLSTVQNAKNRAKNRGRLKTDLLMPTTLRKTEASTSKYATVYGTRTITHIPRDNSAVAAVSFTETVPTGASNMGYYLVENPFPCGLDMNQFFAENSGLEKKYWLLTAGGQQLVQWADNQWVNPNGTSFATDKAVVAPGQGFFVQATTPGEANDITFTDAMQAKTRYGVKSGQGYTQDTDNSYPLLSRQTRSASKEENDLLGLVITAQRDSNSSSALVMLSDDASNDFLPSEDTETFLNSDLKNVPTVYTLCGRLATTINSIREFTCLPLGVESASDALCTLTFQGVELLGDSVAFYDAVKQELTPLESGMQIAVSGQTQNRYYLVTSLNQEKVAEETHLQIFTVGLTAKVIASTAEPILHVRCFDLGGRQVHVASPQSPEYSFNLPGAGVYVIEVETENDHKIQKVMAK